MTNAVAVIALTLFWEAGSESMAGKFAVASVIWNRGKGDPEIMADECWKPRQFSCWNSREKKDFKYYVEAYKDNKQFKHCLAIAELMCEGRFVPTLPATHFCRHDVHPEWRKKMFQVGFVDCHDFFMEGKP